MKRQERGRGVLHTHLIDRLAFGNSLLSGVALFPRAIKVLVTHNAAGVALLTVVLIWLNSLVWLAYAIHRGLVSIAISAVLNVGATTLLLIALILYAA